MYLTRLIRVVDYLRARGERLPELTHRSDQDRCRVANDDRGEETSVADAYSLDSVRDVVSQRRSEIMHRFDAHGVGIGRPDPAGPYVISVYVTADADIPADPQSADGIPLHFVVTGQIRPV
jgi:hypothetical protein